MVLQYKSKKKKDRWKNYSGKEKFNKKVSEFEWRLLSKDKTRILVKQTNFSRVMKKFRQIEFFKHRR